MNGKRHPLYRIACIGEVMIELVSKGENTAKLGVAGDTFNTAVYLSRQLPKDFARVSYVTALGTDSYSDRILDALLSHGLDTSFVERRENQMPGLYAINTDENGERHFSYWRSASAARSLFQKPCKVTLDNFIDYDLIYLSGISLAILPQPIRTEIINWIDDFRRKGGLLAYDSNYRWRLWESVKVARQINTAMWARADIALPSVDDEMSLFGDPSAAKVLERLKATGVRRGALKRGKDGPVDFSSGRVPDGLPEAIEVVDSTAAGDSFNAGFIAAIAQSKSDIEAACLGHEVAIEVVQHPGAIVPNSN